MGSQASDGVIDLVNTPPEHSLNALNEIASIGAPEISSAPGHSDAIRGGKTLDEPDQGVQAPVGAVFDPNIIIDCEMAADGVGAVGAPSSIRKRAACAELDSGVGGKKTPIEKARGGSPTTDDYVKLLSEIMVDVNVNEQMEDVQLEGAAASVEAPALVVEPNQNASPEPTSETYATKIDIFGCPLIPGFIYPGVKIANGADAEFEYEIIHVTIDGEPYALFRSLENPTKLFTRLDELLKDETSYSLENIYISHGDGTRRSRFAVLHDELESLGPIKSCVDKGSQDVKVLFYTEEYELENYSQSVKRQGTTGGELKIQPSENGDRLPYTYEDNYYGYILRQYTEDKFFEVPLIVFVPSPICSEAGNKNYWNSVGWEEIPFKVKKSQKSKNSTEMIDGYQYGNVGSSFGFFLKTRAGVIIEEDNILPPGEKRKSMPTKRFNCRPEPSTRPIPKYVQDINGVLCNLTESWVSSKYDITLEATAHRPDWILMEETTESLKMAISVECDDASHKCKSAYEEFSKLYNQCVAHRRDNLDCVYGALRIVPYSGNCSDNLNYPNEEVLKNDIVKALNFLKSMKSNAKLCTESGLDIALPIVYLYYGEYNQDGKYRGNDTWHPLDEYSRPDCFYMLSKSNRSS